MFECCVTGNAEPMIKALATLSKGALHTSPSTTSSTTTPSTCPAQQQRLQPAQLLPAQQQRLQPAQLQQDSVGIQLSAIIKGELLHQKLLIFANSHYIK